MSARTARLRRAVHVARVARRGRLLRVLREIGVVGSRAATREGARKFRLALEELGTTYIKLGQLLSSRPDLLPDVYIEELGKLVDEVPPVPFAESILTCSRASTPSRSRPHRSRRSTTPCSRTAGMSRSRFGCPVSSSASTKIST